MNSSNIFRRLALQLSAAPLLATALVVSCSDDDIIDPSNEAPVATVTAAPTVVAQGDNHQTVVRIDASASTDPDGDVLSYDWTVPSGRFVNGTANGDAVIEVTFPGLAPYQVEVVVDDGNGGRDTASIVIDIT